MNTSADRSRAFRAVIFDFDYTLADSTPGIVDCVNHAFQVLGLPPASAEAIRETVGLSIPATYERLTGEREGRRSREFRRLFVERADEVMLAGIKVFGSVKPVTEALLRDGMSLGIVSTKFRYRIERALSRDGGCRGAQARPYRPELGHIQAGDGARRRALRRRQHYRC